MLSLYKDGDCFFIYSSFLAGKEAKEAGGTYEWFPLDPLSTSDRGSAPLGRPCSMGRVSTSGRVLCECTARATFHRRATLGLNLCGEEFSFLVRLKWKSTARAKSERRQRAEGATRGRGMAEYKNFGRQRERLSAAYRRAALVVNCAKRIFRFSSKVWCEERLKKVLGGVCVSRQALVLG